jgi:hypothetical protein
MDLYEDAPIRVTVGIPRQLNPALERELRVFGYLKSQMPCTCVANLTLCPLSTSQPSIFLQSARAKSPTLPLEKRFDDLADVEKAADPSSSYSGSNNHSGKEHLGNKFKTLSIKIEGGATSSDTAGQQHQPPPADMPAVAVMGSSGAKGYTPRLANLISPRRGHAVTPMAAEDVLMASKVYTPKRGTYMTCARL